MTKTKEEKETKEAPGALSLAGFEPKIVAFCCNWCSYTGADLAGTSRLQYPHNIKIVRVMCSGMVHTEMIMRAFQKGADGVMICGCHIGDCHYIDGNQRTKDRLEAINLMLEDFDIAPERFRLEWISAAEGQKFAQVMKEMTAAIQKLGPIKQGRGVDARM